MLKNELYRRIQASYKPQEIIDARHFYELNKFSEVISESAYFKVLERLVEKKELIRIARGVYCIPRKSRFGMIPSGEEHILKYYLGEENNSGVLLGYKLFNKHKLTTQISKKIEILSNNIYTQKKTIDNFEIQKANFEINQANAGMVEAFEILQVYEKIEDLNVRNFLSFFKSFARKQFDDQEAMEIILSGRYKKRTIAMMKSILDYYDIENSLDQFLKKTSKYRFKTIGDLKYEIAS